MNRLTDEEQRHILRLMQAPVPELVEMIEELAGALKETLSMLDMVPDCMMPGLYVDPWGALKDAKRTLRKVRGGVEG